MLLKHRSFYQLFMKENLPLQVMIYQRQYLDLHTCTPNTIVGKLCHHEDWEINGLPGNKDISEAREELGALERERQKMEEHKLELERQLTELDTQLTKFNEVSMHSLIWYINVS